MLPYIIILDESSGEERFVVYAADEAGDPIDEPLGTYDNPGEAALLIYTLMQEGQPDEGEDEPEAEPEAEAEPEEEEEEAAADESDDDEKSSENDPNRAAGESAGDSEQSASSSGQSSFSRRKSPIERFRSMLAGLIPQRKNLTATENTQVYGFKALGNGWWIGVFSNNFKDRDNEIITASAHERYILRANFGFVEMPELWFHHIPGSRHGKAVFIDEADHLIYAVGKFDDTPLGKAFEQFYRSTDWKPGMSHGFRVPAWAKTREGHILEYNTFEISVLDLNNAANPYTSFVTVEDIKMALTESQRAALLDARIPKNIRTLVEQQHQQFAAQGKSLETMLGGEAFKDYVDLSDTEAGKGSASDKQEKAGAEKDEKFYEAQGQLLADLLKQSNLQSKALKAFGAILKEVLTELDLEPVAASEADETEVPEPEDDEAEDDLDFDDDEEDEPEPRKARTRLNAKRRTRDDEDTFLGLRLT